MKTFFATAITARPEHSIHEAIFWLLTTLAVLVATLTFKLLFEIAGKGIEQWRSRGHRDGLPSKKNQKPTETSAKKS